MEPRFIQLTRLDTNRSVFFNIDSIVAFLPEGDEATIWVSDGDKFKIKQTDLQIFKEMIWR